MIKIHRRIIKTQIITKLYFLKNITLLNLFIRFIANILCLTLMNLQHILQKSAGYVEPQTSQESQPGAGVGDEDESDAASPQSRNLPPSESSATSREKELLDKVSIYIKNIFSYCGVFCIQSHATRLVLPYPRECG